MSITTYSELQTAVADWMHRTDLTAKIPDFITLAESRINRVILFNEQETKADLTMTIGSRFIALPAGNIRPISMWFTFYGVRGYLTFVPVDIMQVTISQGQPYYWTVDGANLAFDSEADQAYTLTFRYATTDNLSASNTTNWILDSHPDLYLYGALIEAGAYIRDLELVGMAKQGYEEALNEVLEKEHRTKAKAILFTEIPRNEKSNIYEG